MGESTGIGSSSKVSAARCCFQSASCSSRKHLASWIRAGSHCSTRGTWPTATPARNDSCGLTHLLLQHATLALQTDCLCSHTLPVPSARSPPTCSVFRMLLTECRSQPSVTAESNLCRSPPRTSCPDPVPEAPPCSPAAVRTAPGFATAPRLGGGVFVRTVECPRCRPAARLGHVKWLITPTAEPPLQQVECQLAGVTAEHRRRLFKVAVSLGPELSWCPS